MLRNYIAFAWGTFTHRKTRSLLTMIGIFIGIAAVVALIGLGEGLRAAIMAQFGFLSPDVLTIQASGINFAGPPGAAVVNPLTDDMEERLERIPGVEAAINRYIQTGALEFNDRQEIVFSWSMPEGQERRVFESMVNLKAEKGRLLKDGDKFKAVLGSSYADDDLFGKGVHVGNRIFFDGKEFEVVGMLEKKGSFIFDTAIIMNEGILVEEFREDNSVNAIGVKVQDVSLVPQVKEDIEKFLRDERDVKLGEEDFIVESPESALASLDQTLFAVQLFVSVIAFVAIIVGAIGITNTMYTSVLERTKEIGIMKSIGATNTAIFSLFFVESGLLGLIGGVIGVAIGFVLSYSFAFAGRLALGSDLIQAKIGLSLIAGSLLFSVIVGLFAGVIPAYRASKKHPVESLRHAQ